MDHSNKAVSRNKQIIALIINLAIVCMEVVALIISVGKNGILFCQFYTEDSNILAMISCTIFAIFTIRNLINPDHEMPHWVKVLKYVATCCLTVTFVVVITVLAPTTEGNGYHIMMLESSALYHHFLCPVAAIISFLFFEEGVDKKYSRIAVIPTILYAIISVILNVTRVIYGPYIFLHVFEQPVYMSVIWCLVIVFGAFLLAMLNWFLNRKIQK